MQPIAHTSGSEPSSSHVVMAGVAGPLLPPAKSRKKKRDICVRVRRNHTSHGDTKLRQLGTGNQERRITAMFSFP